MLVRSVKTTLIVRERSGDFRKNKEKGKRESETWNSNFLDI